MNPLRAFRRVACATGGTFAAACLALAPAAHADTSLLATLSVPDCSAQTVSQPFAPFLDYSSYFSVPGGGFESSTAGWTLGGGATRVAANEPWQVAGPDDAGALALPAGSSAVSPVVCVGIDSPTMRLFARKTTSDPLGLSLLLVQSVTEDGAGALHTLPIGIVTGDSAWAPSQPMPLLASLVSLLPGDQAPVELRFTPIGAATWQIDDAYIDPYHKCC